jgi:hypothetical protein
VVLSGANAALLARTWSGSASVNAPLTSQPVASPLGSITESAASPAVEITFRGRARFVGAVDAGRERAERRRRAERERERRRHGAVDAPAGGARELRGEELHGQIRDLLLDGVDGQARRRDVGWGDREAVRREQQSGDVGRARERGVRAEVLGPARSGMGRQEVERVLVEPPGRVGRGGCYTVDGRVSDHADGHAADLGMAANGGAHDSPVGDRILNACLIAVIAAGVPPDQAAEDARHGGPYTLQHDGLRVQCIWKTDAAATTTTSTSARAQRPRDPPARRSAPAPRVRTALERARRRCRRAEARRRAVGVHH